MTCAELLYTHSDVDIRVSFADFDFTPSDFNDVAITLINYSDFSTRHIYSLSAGSIVIVNNEFILRIPATDITKFGHYRLSAQVIDGDSALRALTPCPGDLYFFDRHDGSSPA